MGAEGGDSIQPPNPSPADMLVEWDHWFDRRLSRGDPGIVAASIVVFVTLVATLALQIVLVILLAFFVYPEAAGAAERTVVLVALFAALSVFFVEIRTTFTQVIVYRFLTRPRRRTKPT